MASQRPREAPDSVFNPQNIEVDQFGAQSGRVRR
jgi:hypothetical protein